MAILLKLLQNVRQTAVSSVFLVIDWVSDRIGLGLFVMGVFWG